MAETATKLPVKTTENGRAPTHRGWAPMEGLRRDFNRLFEDFGDLWCSPMRHALLGAEPLWSRDLTWAATPAVDIAEKDKTYEITAELPGLDEKNVEVKVANGMLTIRGEKKEEKEEKKKDYYLSERRYGSLELPPLPDPGGRRQRQDRGGLQEGSAHGDATEDRGGAASGRKEDRNQGRLTSNRRKQNQARREAGLFLVSPLLSIDFLVCRTDRCADLRHGPGGQREEVVPQR